MFSWKVIKIEFYAKKSNAKIDVHSLDFTYEIFPEAYFSSLFFLFKGVYYDRLVCGNFWQIRWRCDWTRTATSIVTYCMWYKDQNKRIINKNSYI